MSVPSNNNFISLAPNNQCISKRSTVHIATLGSKANLVRSLSRINMPMYNSDIPDSHQNEVYIPATGDTFAFQFEGVGITGFTPGQVDTKAGILYSWCRKLVAFTPEANGNYEAVFDYVTIEGHETCGVRLFEIKEDGKGGFTRAEHTNYQIQHNYCQ